MLNVCAGSGRTATLQAMATSDTRRGLYAVFRKAAVAKPRRVIRAHVDVLTFHALALRHVRSYGYSDDKPLKRFADDERVVIEQGRYVLKRRPVRATVNGLDKFDDALHKHVRKISTLIC